MIFFFHIWFASVQFRREKSSTWHVSSNFIKTLKFSVKSKFERLSEDNKIKNNDS